MSRITQAQRAEPLLDGIPESVRDRAPQSPFEITKRRKNFAQSSYLRGFACGILSMLDPMWPIVTGSQDHGVAVTPSKAYQQPRITSYDVESLLAYAFFCVLLYVDLCLFS
jgi:hypothetical protein